MFSQAGKRLWWRATHEVPRICMLSLLIGSGMSVRPVQAGTWTLHVSSSSYTHTLNGSNFGAAWTAPGDGTNAITLKQVEAGGSGLPGHGEVASATLNATITGTWVPDPALPSDPAPPNVKVKVVSNASSYGIVNGTTQYGTTADDGYADPVTAAGVSSGTHYIGYTGSSFTLVLSLSASYNAPASTTGLSFADAKVGSVSISIHAQPYNFKLGPYTDPNSGSHPDGVGVDNVDGRLHFHYVWSSTDGNIADLTSIKVYEHVSYLGNSTGSYYTDANGTPIFAPTNPPFNWTIEQTYDQPDPVNSGYNGPGGVFDDYQLHGTFPTAPADHVSANYNATQQIKFDDTDTGETGISLLGPITISRSVVSGTMGNWTYTVTKSGYTASKSL